MSSLAWMQQQLAERLDPSTRDWLETTTAKVAGGLDHDRFCALLSLASRYVPKDPLDPSVVQRQAATGLLPGWDPERWTLRETARVTLVLSHPTLEQETGARAIEEAFRYADEGELRALYRSLAHVPAAERFAWRVGEGCRSNMVSVFQAAACDTPFPKLYFDEVAFNQAVIKAVFIGAPVWRIHGLDERLSAELARMALDLADERRSAGRAVPHELWLCLGAQGGERGLASLELEFDGGAAQGRAAASVALARSGA